jgi:hypothetical protein
MARQSAAKPRYRNWIIHSTWKTCGCANGSSKIPWSRFAAVAPCQKASPRMTLALPASPAATINQSLGRRVSSGSTQAPAKRHCKRGKHGEHTEAEGPVVKVIVHQYSGQQYGNRHKCSSRNALPFSLKREIGKRLQNCETIKRSDIEFGQKQTRSRRSHPY